MSKTQTITRREGKKVPGHRPGIPGRRYPPSFTKDLSLGKKQTPEPIRRKLILNGKLTPCCRGRRPLATTPEGRRQRGKGRGQCLKPGIGPMRKESFPGREERNTLGKGGKFTVRRLATLLLSPTYRYREKRDSSLNQGDEETGDKRTRIGLN